MKVDKTAQQAAILWVVRAACITFVLGAIGMFALAWTGRQIPDQYDRLVQLAAVGALALLGRVSDSKAEAKDAVEKVVNDLAALGPPAPMPVEGVPGGEPVAVAPTDADADVP